MGKEGELWDDSALINAFEHAMSTYKKMHGKKKHDDSTDAGEVGNGIVGDSPIDGSEIHEPVREGGGNINNSPHITEFEENKNDAAVGENHHVGYSESGPGMPAHSGYSYSQVTEDYNQLLTQYYELEEKRQWILQQLNQLGSHSYQYPSGCSGSGVQQGTCFTSNDHSVLPSQAHTSTCYTTCCPYACHCSAAPCSSFPPCSLCPASTAICKTCNDSSGVIGCGKGLPSADSDIAKMAMRAAEKVISSMKLKPPANSCSKLEEEENREDNEREMDQSASTETDLGAVLNAWYSAGFYTGKYLTEQSISKKWHG